MPRGVVETADNSRPMHPVSQSTFGSKKKGMGAVNTSHASSSTPLPSSVAVLRYIGFLPVRAWRGELGWFGLASDVEGGIQALMALTVAGPPGSRCRKGSLVAGAMYSGFQGMHVLRSVVSVCGDRQWREGVTRLPLLVFLVHNDSNRWSCGKPTRDKGNPSISLPVNCACSVLRY